MEYGIPNGIWGVKIEQTNEMLMSYITIEISKAYMVIRDCLRNFKV